MASPLCHFEFMSNEPEKCREFYGSVFGWEFDDQLMPDYTLIKTGSEPGGGLMQRPTEVPNACMYVYFMVDDIPAALDRIETGGGTIHRGETEIPDVGWFAMAADPEGIVFGLFKSK